MAAAGATVLLVTAEESKEQVRLRADRLGALHPNLLIVAETSLPHVLTHVAEVAPGRRWRSTRSRPSPTRTSPESPAR